MNYIIGLDEVGRGCLAGPVVVAAAVMPKGLKLRVNKLGRLRDSKKLSPRQREAWVKYLAQDPRIKVSFGRVYPRGIDRLNISQAANLAALRAFRSLLKRAKPAQYETFLDGGLYLGRKELVRGAHTIIKGDQKIPAIQIASIFAKVHRDEYMRRLSKRFPAYGFEIHKGYGTRTHVKALRANGLTPHHRLTFLKRYTTIVSTKPEVRSSKR